MLLMANDSLDKLIQRATSRLEVDVNAAEEDDENEGTIGPPTAPAAPPPVVNEKLPIPADIKAPDVPPKLASERVSRTSSAFGSSVDTHNSNTM
jgi:hypothetical protein